MNYLEPDLQNFIVNSNSIIFFHRVNVLAISPVNGWQVVGKLFINQIGTYGVKRAFYHQLLEMCLQFCLQ